MPTNEAFEAPLRFVDQVVAPEWVDFNGHMNVAYYFMVFDRCVDVMFNRLGIGPDQIPQTGCSVFTLEAHINYLREVVESDPLKVTGRLLDFDGKRVHAYFEMHHADDGHIVSAMEQVGIHVSMAERRAAPFAERSLRLLESMRTAHQALPVPEYAGRVIGIRGRR